MPIPIANPDLGGNELAYVTDALINQQRISSHGTYLDRFEDHAAKRFGRSHATATSNGTTALHLALLGLGIGPGDEVIVPTFTFAATAAVVRHCGAIPVFVDVRPDDWTIDVSKLDSVLTQQTKAVISVDIYGMPCDYRTLEAWCQAHHLFLIEDAAEAHGARYNDRPVGSFGDVACFSFYGNKILTTGEGGVCVTNDAQLLERMRILKNHGMTMPGSYEHNIVGYNYRMTNVQAAIGCAQFERFDAFLAARENIRQLYLQHLKDVPGVTLQRASETSKQPVFWLFSILLDSNPSRVAAELKQRGIETRPLFKPLHLQGAYHKFAQGLLHPVSEALHARGISLPSHSQMTEEDVKTICSNLIECLRNL